MAYISSLVARRAFFLLPLLGFYFVSFRASVLRRLDTIGALRVVLKGALQSN